VRAFADPALAVRDALLARGVVWERPPEIAADAIAILRRSASHLDKTRLLIVFDQFEEFLILNDRQRESNESSLKMLRFFHENPVSGVKFLFVVRSDYIHLLQRPEWSDIFPRLDNGSNWFEIGGFRERDARNFLERSGLQIGPALLDKLFEELRDIEGTPGFVRPITLNMVGIALDAVAISLSRTLRSKRAGGLIFDYVAREISKPAVSSHAPIMLNRMITEAGTKEPRRVLQLAELTKFPADVIKGCLLHLENSSIVRALDKDKNLWEISHDFIARLLSQILRRRGRTAWTIARATAVPISLVIWAAVNFVAQNPQIKEIGTTQLARIDELSGYRYTALDRQAPKSIDKSAVIMTFSGGGTRAAALADGALRALAATEVPGMVGRVPLASQIDVVSSVSGGSVTAAYFALHGADDLSRFEKDFLFASNSSVDWTISRLCQISAQVGMTTCIFDRLGLGQPRSDMLLEHLNNNVFQGKTYRDLISADQPGRSRRPYIVLYGSDLDRGGAFSFTQDQFDLICADLMYMRIADAVSTSAGYPLPRSRLQNRAPCDAQQNATETAGTGWKLKDGWPEPVRIINDRAVDTDLGIDYPREVNLARFHRGMVSLPYLNRDKKKDFIELLDGGIADNLGLTMPLTSLTSPSESPSFLNWVNTGKADKLLFIVVNARSEGVDPGSFGLLGQLDRLIDDRFNPKSLFLVDFDLIADPGCRAYFHNIATSWALPHQQVEDLIAMGEAMVLQSPRYRQFVAALHATAPPPQRSVEQICSPYHTEVKTAAKGNH
jgi:NTE family protein